MAKIIYNNIIPWKGFQAITIWPVIFARTFAKYLRGDVINHESIHLKQQFEVLVVSVAVDLSLILGLHLSWWWMVVAPLFYYIWYCIEYVIRTVLYSSSKSGYRNISFEQEAFMNEKDFNYLKERDAFAWLKYIGKKTYTKQ